jgi:hypothetical protein
METERELELLRRVKAGELRIIHSQRRRKLQKRGVRRWWEPYFAAWLWEPTK